MTDSPLAAQRVWRRAPEIAFGVAVAGAAALLLGLASHLWFFGDDWDFLLHRGVRGNPDRGLFVPHNEHWSTAPILVFRALFALFGLRHYLPYAAVVVAVHVAITVVVWLLLRRHGIRPWIASAFGAVIAISGAGAENTLWDFQVGYLLPVLVAATATLIMPTVSELTRRDLVVVALLGVGLMSSGQGLPAVAVVASYAYLSRAARPALFFVAASGVIYLTWYGLVGRTALAQDHLSWNSVAAVPAYVWVGLGNVWSAITGAESIGLVVLLLCFVALVRDAAQHPRRGALSASFLLGAIAMFVLAGLTRAQLGVAQSTSGRYVYIAGVLTVPVVASAVQRGLGEVGTRSQAVRALSILVWLLVVVNSLHSLVQYADWREGLSAGGAARFVGAWQLATDGSILLRNLPDPTYAPEASVSEIGILRADQLPRVAARQDAVLAAAAWLQVDVRQSEFPLPSATDFRGSGVGPSRGTFERGCLRGTTKASGAYVDVPLASSGAAFSLRTSDAHIVTELVRGGVVSPAVDWPIVSGTRVYIGGTARNADIRVRFPGQASVELCAQSSRA